MTERSRTEYSARNTTAAMLSRVVAILMGFFTRVVFTHTLSEAYVGINGLFTDILNVLALSELGVGTAITYALYRPIAEGNLEKQKSLMQLYRKFYRVVAGLVLLFGLAVVPFLNVLVKSDEQIEHLPVIYLMYLAGSVLSYLLIYKRTLIDAHQLLYVGTIYKSVFLVLQNVVQIAVLLWTGNFILFLSIYIICTILGNLCLSLEADKRYPYLKDKTIKPLEPEEKQKIFSNIKAMLMHKIGVVLVNNTDNLLLSYFAGIVSVGCYSNYYLIIGSVRQVLDEAFQGITASVGNLGVTEGRERVKTIFEASFFAGQWMYGFAAICLYELLNPFVEISFGAKYLFPPYVVLILCINFYVTGMRKATLVFRDSLGLFWYDRYKSIVEAVINLVVSVILASRFGTVGVFVGTFISTVTTSLWVEPYMLYKHHLKESSVRYFVKYAVYSGVLAGCWWIVDWLCRMVQGGVWLVLLVRLIICVVVPNVLLLVIYWRTAEFAFLRKKAAGIIHKRIRR